MNFLELIRDKIPEECGVDKAYGMVAGVIFERELDGDIPEFSQEHFAHYGQRACMERIKVLYMPYPPVPGKEKIHAHWREFLDLTSCQHRQIIHGDDFEERISFLEVGMTDEEIEWAKRGWWSN